MTARTERPILGLLFRAAAMLLMSTLVMLLKLAGERGIATPEVMFWRQATTIPIMFVALALMGRLGNLRTRRWKSHAARAAVGTAGLFCNVTAAVMLPLAEATTIGFTAPMFAVLVSVLVMHERVGWWRLRAVALGFAGVVIIAQPGYAPVPLLGIVAGLGSALVVAVAAFQIRDLTRTEDPIACVFYFAVFGALIASLMLPFYASRHDLGDILVLLGIGLSGTAGQLLITLSLRQAAVSTVIVMDYTALIWSTLFGWLVWDRLPPSVTWLGAPLIIGAGLIIIWREHRLSRAIPPANAMEED